MNEQQKRLNQIKAFMAENDLEGLLLRRTSSFAWATCGAASYINTAATEGAGSLLLTPKADYILTTNIEAPRMEKEEMLAEQGWKILAAPWHSSEDPVSVYVKNLKLGADGFYPGAKDVSDKIARLRTQLSPEECDRFRELGKLSAGAMNDAIHQVRPGYTEYEIAGLLAAAAQKRGVQAIVNLIATDERIFNFRHPLPTGKTMEKYAMLVLCGRKKGLVCSVTRLVHFGELSAELKKKMDAVAYVDAAFIHATRPGNSIRSVFQKALAAYEKTGFAEEWHLHHQGGPAGYEPREFIATPETEELVYQGQTYAWNPSITGCKSEDTILVGEYENEVLSEIPGWPMVKVIIEGHEYQRPAILEVE